MQDATPRTVVHMATQAIPAGQAVLRACFSWEVSAPVALLTPDGGATQALPLARVALPGNGGRLGV